MEKALKPLGVRRGAGRQEGLELHAEHDGTDHLILRGTRVNIHALDVQRAGSRIKVLVLDAADFTAVHRVGDFRAEALHVEELCALSDFLIRRETDAELAVAVLRVLVQIFDERHDLCDTGLVVRAEQRAAVRDQERIPLGEFQLREGLRREHFAVSERNVPALIFLDEARLHIRVARRGRGIHVGDETECRCHRIFRLCEIRGNARVDIALVRETHILCAELL